VPEPFVLEYAAYVDDHHSAERLIHRSLREHRPNRGREFFEVAVPDAIALIRQSCPVLREDVHYKSPEEIRLAEAIRRRQHKEEEERQKRVQERNERISNWTRTKNADAENQRQRLIESKVSDIRGLVGGGAVLGVAMFIDYGGWAIAGVLLVAWLIYSTWHNTIVTEARQKYPSVTASDYEEESSSKVDRRSGTRRIRCQGCNVLLNVPSGKSLNITCPRCRTIFFQKT
jgi:ribosomal protein S27E